MNFRGVQPVYVPAVWKINAPPKIHVFLWLLSNKLMTVDNLVGRGIKKPPESQFCNENEPIFNIFFYCIVAKQLWVCLFEFNGTCLWLANGLLRKKYKAINTISAGVVQMFMANQKRFHFRGQKWSNIKLVLGRLWSIMKEWTPMLQMSLEEDIAR